MLSLPVSMDSLDMCPLRNSNDCNAMLAEGDFPPDLETSDVSFSVHQQNGEGKTEEKEGQGIKKEGGHDSSAQGDPKNMRQVSMLTTDDVSHNNYIDNGHFLVCHTQQSFSCRRSTSWNS